MKIRDQVRTYVIKNFLYSDPQRELTDDQSFINSGIIDSTCVLELVSFIENTFSIQVEDEDLIPENLDSIGKVASFVLRKKRYEKATA